ncbi:MAG: hypothetical protein WB615_08435, partial [Candidatus Tumulicola sp.]
MKNLCLALALALIALPATAFAQVNPTASAPPRLTPEQRQAISKTMQTFREKELQMHQQLRSQILGALSPDHRTAVAGVIGEMVISDNPDPAAAAKRIDAVLSPGEQQKILADHSTFVSQSQVLMQQMHAQLQSQMPAGAPGAAHWGAGMHRTPSPMASDAGSVVMM